MPSEAAKKRAAQKKAQKQASSRSAQKKTVVTAPVAKDEEEVKSKLTNGASATTVSNGLSEGVAGMKITQRSCTGTYVQSISILHSSNLLAFHRFCMDYLPLVKMC